MATRYKDYYKLLGVAPEASAEDIKNAYRKLARKLHPDVNKATDAQARFIDIGEAYEALGDPEKRAAYDQLRQVGYKEGEEIGPMPQSARGYGGASGGGGFGRSGGFTGAAGEAAGGFGTEVDPEAFSDFFQQLFGQSFAGAGGRGRSRRAAHQERGEDITHPLGVTLEEAYAGGQRRLQMQVPQLDQQGRMKRATRTIDVKIPVGVTEGTRIRLKGQGESGSAPEFNGDLYLEVHLEPHSLYTVDGRTVHLILPVAPWEAVLGTSLRVPTLGGPVTLRIPPGSSAEDKLRLRGRGLPGEPPGDQIVTLVIVVPTQLTEAQTALYTQLAAASTSFNPRSHLGA